MNALKKIIIIYAKLQFNQASKKSSFEDNYLCLLDKHFP